MPKDLKFGGNHSFRPFIFAVLVALLAACQCRAINMEGSYLLQVKSSLRDGFGHLANWNSEDETPCAWVGVHCTSDYYNPVVSSLNLKYMNLFGILSPSIGGLVHLTSLDLSFNLFSGNIPRDIGNCSSLVSLVLNNNNFEGRIPSELGNLFSLKSLNITGLGKLQQPDFWISSGGDGKPFISCRVSCVFQQYHRSIATFLWKTQEPGHFPSRAKSNFWQHSC